MPIEHYRMYVDECGTDDVVNTHDIRYRHLALTGVISSVAHMRHVVTPALDALKRKHFPGYDPDGPPLVLHRSDFLAAKGPFQEIGPPAKREAFIHDLCNFLSTFDHRVITVVLDKDEMLKKEHWKNKEPYHYCAEVLGEKFVRYLERVDGRGDIYAESRKHKKNTALAKAFEEVYRNGTKYVSSARFAKRLTTPEIKFRDKPDNTTGLQIADVYAKPSFDRIMSHRDKSHEVRDFSKRIGRVLVFHTYDRDKTDYVLGYGMKYIT